MDDLKALMITTVGVLGMALGSSVEAATLSVQPSSASVAPSQSFTIDLLLDASDAPGTHPGLYGGRIVLDFDPTLVNYVDFALASGLSFLSAPVVGSSGSRQTVTLGFDDAPDTGVVGTFSFTATGAPGSLATFNIEDADPFFGSFIAKLPTNQPFYPQFLDTSVAIVPLPGAAWLMLTAFGVVGLRARSHIRRTR